MYKVSNFYQNHRRYVQSKSREQLAGKIISKTDAQSCWPYMTNKQMGKEISWGNSTLDP